MGVTVHVLSGEGIDDDRRGNEAKRDLETISYKVDVGDRMRVQLKVEHKMEH